MEFVNKNGDLEMFQNYRRLRYIKRCNNYPTIISMDVAQHSYFTTMIAMILTDEYNTWVEEHNLGYHPSDMENYYVSLKTETVLRKALVHDIEESFTSDIPYNVKHLNAKIHDALVEDLGSYVDLQYIEAVTTNLYNKLNKSCKSGFEGQVVAVSDMIELAWYCCDEMALGNVHLKPILARCKEFLDEFEFSKILRVVSEFYKSVEDMIKGALEGNNEKQ